MEKHRTEDNTRIANINAVGSVSAREHRQPLNVCIRNIPYAASYPLA